MTIRVPALPASAFSTLASSHVPMLSHPDEVADFVIAAAASLVPK